MNRGASKAGPAIVDALGVGSPVAQQMTDEERTLRFGKVTIGRPRTDRPGEYHATVEPPPPWRRPVVEVDDEEQTMSTEQLATILGLIPERHRLLFRVLAATACGSARCSRSTGRTSNSTVRRRTSRSAGRS